MILKGLQKLTLLDFPGNLACTVFTGGCNFRCPFCHNASLVTDAVDSTISESDFFSFLKSRQGKLDGVAITGGEPLLHHDIPDFIKKIRALGFAVKIDTNGSFPDMLKLLIDEKLVDYVAMDIKSSPKNYGKLAGIQNFDIAPVLRSVSILMEGRVPFEFRTTVVKELHDLSDFQEIGKWIEGAPKYFLQAFVDSGNTIEKGFSAMSKPEMLALTAALKPYLPSADVRGI